MWSRPFFRGMWGLLGDFDMDSVYEDRGGGATVSSPVGTPMFSSPELVPTESRTTSAQAK